MITVNGFERPSLEELEAEIQLQEKREKPIVKEWEK